MDSAFPPFGDPNETAQSGRPAAYTNPILDWDFPDPAIIHAPDGFYYAYATQSLRHGEWINIQVARSADLIDWEYLGDALPEKPDWARTTQDFWAPSVLAPMRKGVKYQGMVGSVPVLAPAGSRCV